MIPGQKPIHRTLEREELLAELKKTRYGTASLKPVVVAGDPEPEGSESRSMEIDDETREVELSFSSDTFLEHWFGDLQLVHTSEAADLKRANDGGALLFNHNTDDHIGKISKAWIDSKEKEGQSRGRAVVKFGRGKMAEEKFQDVKDGILNLVSFMFSIDEIEDAGYRLIDMGDGETYKQPKYRATKWTVFEVSMVTIPRDASVGVGRDLGAPAELGGGKGKPAPGEVALSTIQTPIKEKTMLTEEQMQEALAKAKKEGQTEERELQATEAKEIRRTAEKIGTPAIEKLALEFIASGKSSDEFKRELVESHFKSAKAVDGNPELGMSQKERNSYSFTRALASAVKNGGVPDGLEGEAHKAQVKLLRGVTPKGFMIPYDILVHPKTLLRRDMTAGSGVAGGAVIDTELMSAMFIDLLRNRMVTSMVGITSLDGLVGDIAIPRLTGDATQYWVGENDEATESTPGLGQILMKPKRSSAWVDISKQLLVQASLDVESLVRNSLAAIMARARDKAIITGKGGEFQPLGILNASGINSVALGTNGDDPDFDSMVNMETEVADDNADVASMAYVTNARGRGKLKRTAVEDGYPEKIWGNPMPGMPFGSGIVNGYPAFASNQIPKNLTKASGSNLSAVIFANWADVIMGSWAGMDVVVDGTSASNAKKGLVTVVVHELIDIQLRRLESFCAIKDMVTT